MIGFDASIVKAWRPSGSDSNFIVLVRARRGVSEAAFYPSLLELQPRASTRQFLRNEPAQPMWARCPVQQPVTHERDQRLDLVLGQRRGRAEQGVQTLEHRPHWTDRTTQVRRQSIGRERRCAA